MSHYRLGAAYACEERLDWLKQQLAIASSDTRVESRRREMLVMEQYLRVGQDRSFAPEFATVAGMFALVREVVETPTDRTA